MQATDLDWRDIIPEPFVILELGARGEGKSALSHRLAEVFGGPDTDRDAYIMGFPEEKAHLLPEWMEVLPIDTTKEQWPEDSIVIMHEAHQFLHARESMNAGSLELDKLITISRHKNSDIIYDTQQSQRLDKNSVASVDAICVRWPALMQEDFERRAVRPIIKDARETLSKYVTVHDEDDFTFVERETDEEGVDLLKKHVYVHADQFRGEYPHELQLASHWSESISKAHGEVGENGAGGDIKTLDDLSDGMAKPEEIGQKSGEEVEQIIAEAKGETDDSTEATAESTETTTTTQTTQTSTTTDSGGSGGGGMEDRTSWRDGYTDEELQNAKQYIDQTRDAGEDIMSNNSGGFIFEILVPRDRKDEVLELINENQIRPDASKVISQEPLFHDAADDFSFGLVSLQLNYGDRSSMTSTGYDLQSIVTGLENSDVRVMYTANGAIGEKPEV